MSTLNGPSKGTSSPVSVADVNFRRLGDDPGQGSSHLGSSSSRSKGKERRVEDKGDGSQRNNPSTETPRPVSLRSSGGFLLDTPLANGSPRISSAGDRTKGHTQNGQLRVGKTRAVGNRLSVESSIRGSPLSREVSMDGADDQAAPAISQSGGIMDPAQLVQMALELSESRRRHTSGPLRVPLPTHDTRRSSGRQRVSYTTVEAAREANVNAQPISIENHEDPASLQSFSEDIPHSFSPATLSRAERARKYFELASEYRRLLQSLPPLKPDSTAPGNHHFVSRNSPGSAFPQITQVPSHAGAKHDLGRPYNPLQALRNRRIRNRERQALPAPPEAWQDSDEITRWIDGVERASEDAFYRDGPDKVRLPRYTGDTGDSIPEVEPIKGHRRTDTVSSVLTRPQNGWSIEPCELLADAYWTEQGEHKFLLETRRGSPLFPPYTRTSLDNTPRSPDGPSSKGVQEEEAQGHTNEPRERRSHRGSRLLPRLPGKSHRASRSGSTSSVSSTEGKKPTLSLEPDNDDADIVNTGPLEKQMRQLMEKDARGELSSPELVSPDHWDSKPTMFPPLHGHGERAPRESLNQTNGSLAAGLPFSPHRRAKSADGRMGSRGAIEDVSLAGSPSPAAANSVDSEYHGDTLQVDDRRDHRRLPLFRAHSKTRSYDQTNRTDFANGGGELSQLEPRSSVDSVRPNFVRRHITTDSTNSLRPSRTATSTSTSTRDVGSGVGRFFKGGRIGEMVRNEGAKIGDRLSDRFRNRDRVDDVQPMSEESAQSHASEDEGPRGETLSVEPSPRTSFEQKRRPKYHLQNLPTFRSPTTRTNTHNPDSTTFSADSDPISRQQRAQRQAGRSPRFDRLAPPRINLPGDEDSTAAPSTQRSDTFIEDDRRKSYGFFLPIPRSQRSSHVSLGTPGEIHPNNRIGPTSSLAYAQPFDRRGARHWSISDRLINPSRNASSPSHLSVRDVARVRALLLTSGIKAREIQYRANHPRKPPPIPIYTSVAQFLHTSLADVPIREEHLVASRLLIENLTSTLDAFSWTLGKFQSESVASLTAHLESMQRHAIDSLTADVQRTSDDADALNVELTTKVPQDVKRVDDAIDEILRERRRQFRWVRRTGFKLLEWTVLGIMWWVWFVVVVFKGMRRVVMGVVGIVRWLLWF